MLPQLSIGDDAATDDSAGSAGLGGVQFDTYVLSSSADLHFNMPQLDDDGDVDDEAEGLRSLSAIRRGRRGPEAWEHFRRSTTWMNWRLRLKSMPADAGVRTFATRRSRARRALARDELRVVQTAPLPSLTSTTQVESQSEPTILEAPAAAAPIGDSDASATATSTYADVDASSSFLGPSSSDEDDYPRGRRRRPLPKPSRAVTAAGAQADSRASLGRAPRLPCLQRPVATLEDIRASRESLVDDGESLPKQDTKRAARRRRERRSCATADVRNSTTWKLAVKRSRRSDLDSLIAPRGSLAVGKARSRTRSPRRRNREDIPFGGPRSQGRVET